MSNVSHQDESDKEVYMLFVIGNNESNEAVKILKNCGVQFIVSEVNPKSPDIVDFSDLPTLMGGQGNWSGLNAIKRFVDTECRAAHA